MSARRLAALALAGPLLVLPAGGAPAAGSPASSVVERLHAMLVENVAAGQTRGFDERRAALEPVVAQVFDFDAIARVALGAAWEDMDATRRGRVRDLLERESVLTYAARFGGGDAVRFEIDSEQPVRRGRVLVRTRLLRDEGDAVSLDYVLHGVDGRWRIVNVLAEGVSDLSLKRAQYAAIVREAGVDELLQRLEEKVAALAREGAAGS